MTDRGVWVGVALGAPLVALGVSDALGAADDTKPAELAGWILGGLVILDGVVIPAALLVGRSVGQRASLRWAIAATATLAVVAWPYVRGYGRDPRNPSVLPRDYGSGLLVAVALVWIVAAGWALWRRRPSRPGCPVSRWAGTPELRRCPGGARARSPGR